MPFLSAYSAWAKVSYLVWDSVMMGVVGWKVMRFGELEDDLINPTDFSRVLPLSASTAHGLRTLNG